MDAHVDAVALPLRKWEMTGRSFSAIPRYRKKGRSSRERKYRLNIAERPSTDKGGYTRSAEYTISFRERKRRFPSYRAVTREHASTRVRSRHASSSKLLRGLMRADRRSTCAHECRRFLSLLRPTGPENMAIKLRQEKHARLEDP